MRAIIFTGGDIGEGTSYRPQDSDFIICADSGYRHCMMFGIKPDIVMGDFDSMPDYNGENAVRYKKEKDETDTLLAVEIALEKGCEEIIIFGALGGRLDHELANICLLKKILDSGACGIIDSGKNKILLINKRLRLMRGESKYVSIFPAFGEAVGVTLKGMKYTLTSRTLSPGDTIGISNEIMDEYGEIDVKKGYLLVLLCSD